MFAASSPNKASHRMLATSSLRKCSLGANFGILYRRAPRVWKLFGNRSDRESSSSQSRAALLVFVAASSSMLVPPRYRKHSARYQKRKVLRCSSTTRTKMGNETLEGLGELRKIWEEEIRPDFAPDIDRDPFLSPPNVDTMLARFLKAELNQKGDIASTAARLRETAEWRRDYHVLDFHQKGMARKLMMHASNPGACIYFGDVGLRDLSGEPVLIGRASLMTDKRAPGRKKADNRIPCTHLRAGMFVIERVVHEAKDSISYIVDLSDFPKDSMEKYSYTRYWDADGVVDCSEAIKQHRAPTPSVGPHLASHVTLEDGLAVLKEAIRMVTRYYPEQLKYVYFYRPGFVFRALFAIFSLWVTPVTREKFVLVNEGEEHKYFLSACDPSHVPSELGGTGKSLEGDRFLAEAVERYDKMAEDLTELR
eukprot:TRINITY_DN32483_c0_g1_i1.p1 TRINITY_DN32483_c0_g1~~TRINITY_DN32483_c0_g1_i1.p1  ORF type:complete len:423 (-),score=53.52 TRINITY_DN32483_c0_g1_i1:360-1628(-)